MKSAPPKLAVPRPGTCVPEPKSIRGAPTLSRCHAGLLGAGTNLCNPFGSSRPPAIIPLSPSLSVLSHPPVRAAVGLGRALLSGAGIPRSGVDGACEAGSRDRLRRRSRAPLPRPGDRAELQTPTGAGRAEPGRLRVPAGTRRVFFFFSRSHEFPDPVGRGFGFVCLRRKSPWDTNCHFPRPPSPRRRLN